MEQAIKPLSGFEKMTKVVKPLSPFEVADKNEQLRKSRIPLEVIEIVNKMLIKEYEDGHTITLLQKDILAEVSQVLKIDKQEIYAKKLLDFEPVFRDAGWVVQYDKPAYHETYEPSFIFSKDKSFRT